MRRITDLEKIYNTAIQAQFQEPGITPDLDPAHPVWAAPLQENNSPAPIEKVVRTAMETALSQKALDVVAFDVRGLSPIADYLIVASGTSERHVQGIAERIKRSLRELGESPHSMSTGESKQWIAIDYGDLVVHVFYEPTRQYYEFDELWRHAPRVAMDSELERLATRLRTGIYK